MNGLYLIPLISLLKGKHGMIPFFSEPISMKLNGLILLLKGLFLIYSGFIPELIYLLFVFRLFFSCLQLFSNYFSVIYICFPIISLLFLFFIFEITLIFIFIICFIFRIYRFNFCIIFFLFYYLF